jgi:hypothetical protein
MNHKRILLFALAIIAAAAMLFAAVPAQTTGTTGTNPATNTCILYGATSWAGISLLVILVSLMIVAVVYQFSGIFPNSTRAKIREASRSELTQAFLSVVIIVILAGVATTACSISTSVANSLHATSTTTNPFQYAEYYIGNLSTNTGLNLLTTIYSTSVSYSIEAQVLDSIGSLATANIKTFAGPIGRLFYGAGTASKIVSFTIGKLSQLSTVFSLLSSTYLDVIAPLVTLAVGLLLIQFILLPIFQYTAFSVILPVAIGMRSLAFLGTNLRAAANAVLVIAIAAYIIYPLMIAFNGYAIGWIFSSANPSYQYVHTTYVVPNIPASNFFKLNATAYNGTFGTAFRLMGPFITSAFAQSGGFIINPYTIMTQAQMIINETAQFLFTAVIMIVIDLAVVIGFAVGLTKALNSGIEGGGSFWDGI